MRYGAKIENQARDIFDHYRTPLVEVCDNQLVIKLITHHTQPPSYPTHLTNVTPGETRDARKKSNRKGKDCKESHR